MNYTPVQAVSAYLWGRRVGVLARLPNRSPVFEYDPAFMRSGLEIAPFAMPLSRAVYSSDEFELPRRSLSGLPGVFADSLPDSFGNLLVKKWMASRGIDVSSITPLDRLAYVGSRGMGALVYRPEIRKNSPTPTAVDMHNLAAEARIAMNAGLSAMDGTDALREIIRVGTSAGGAQSKAVVGWNRSTGAFVAGDSDIPEGFEHWIVKFTPKELPDSGRLEYETHLKAVAAGIAMSECRLVKAGGETHFMTRRFDRSGPRRRHVQTLCALRHLPPGSPSSLCSYDVLFETAEALSLSYPEREEIFRRMAFNVFNREYDDHTKNFSFMMEEDGIWRLAPAYDLTGTPNPLATPEWNDWQSRHALSVNGKFQNVTPEDLLAVGERHAIGTAPALLRQVHSAFT